MTGNFRILAADGADAMEWSALISRLPVAHRDIHFLPEYGRVYAVTHGVEPRLAVFESDYGFVVQPFIVRSLDELPFLKEAGATGFVDISNAYGHGGPLYACGGHAAAESLIAAFEREFVAYCESQSFASEFCSLHPLLGNAEDITRSGVALTEEKEIVYMDLGTEEADIWRGVRKGHKSSITKARRENVKIEHIAGNEENLEAFKTLYYATMARRQAAERWLFPQSYFANCVKILGEARTSLHFARVGGELAVATILMHDFGTAYYHFAGSDPRFNGSGASNLLVYEAGLWAKRSGYRYFYLGGGVTAGPEDSLFLFKSGFSGLRAKLYTYGRVLHEPTYRKLSALKLDYEQKAGWEGNSAYFPLYRR
jgi:serine/alanine adding enzyme